MSKRTAIGNATGALVRRGRWAACLLLFFSATLAGAQGTPGAKSPQGAKATQAQSAQAVKSAKPVQKALAGKNAKPVTRAQASKNKQPPRRAQATRRAPPASSTGTASPDSAQGAQSAQSLQSPAAPAEYRLGSGDAIRVLVFQSPDLTTEARVSERGSISFPLIGDVNVGKLSIPQAEKRIADALRSRRMIKAPHVNIVLLQVRGSQVSVLGEVHRPGRFPLETVNVRVSDMLAAAGGVTPTGDDLLVLTGTRQGKPFRRTIDVPALFTRARSSDDVLLEGGDTLYVHKASVFYIYGQAQRPGPYRIERGMTVMQALAQGGGPTPRGDPDRLRLIRKLPDGAVVQSAAQLTDRVHPGDVLFVRESIF